ncbi:MAG TPA: response regulator, partial [Alphaproteobacteria bacterium]|nr:response regulator [Alphaproteobacteria bacterium]
MANSSTEAGWRCLVADDHTLVRELLVRMLRRHMDGIAIREAGSLAEVESACAEGLDLALLDLGMPGMAGA